MGGFSGTVPEPTLAKVQGLVRTGQLRFFLIDGTGAGAVAGFAPGGRGATAATIDSWVEGACATVPATDYQATTGTGGAGAGGGFGAVGGTLYECSRTA